MGNGRLQYTLILITRRCPLEDPPNGIGFITKHVGGLAFSWDGRFVGAVCEDGYVRVWTTQTREERYAVPFPHSSVYEARSIASQKALALSADGGRLAMAWPEFGVVDLEPRKQMEIYRESGIDGDIWHVAFSPNGQRLAVSRFNGNVSLVDSATGQMLHSMRDPVPRQFFCLFARWPNFGRGNRKRPGYAMARRYGAGTGKFLHRARCRGRTAVLRRWAIPGRGHRQRWQRCSLHVVQPIEPGSISFSAAVIGAQAARGHFARELVEVPVGHAAVHELRETDDCARLTGRAVEERPPVDLAHGEQRAVP